MAECLAIVLTFMRSINLSVNFGRLSTFKLMGSPKAAACVVVTLIVATNSVLIIFVKRSVSVRKVKGKASLVVFSNVVTEVPSSLCACCGSHFISTKSSLVGGVLFSITLLVTVLLIIVLIICIRRTRHGVPVRCSGHTSNSGRSTRLPLGVGSTKIVPMVFTDSFVVAPRAVLKFFTTDRDRTD